MKKYLTITVVAILNVLGQGVAAQAQTIEPASTVIKPAISRVTFEAGVLYWQGTSKLQEDRGGPPNKLVSRLTFSNMASRSIEMYGRLDVGRLFMKGNIGLGGVSSGQMKDEDWDLYDGRVPYQKTQHQIHGGAISSATIDVGRTVLKRGNKKIGVFLGYNHYAQRMELYGCTQIAPNVQEYSRGCGFDEIPKSMLTSIVDTVWKSVRVGTIVESKFNRFKVNGEVVLIGTKLINRDNHLARFYTTWFDDHGYGYGFEAEAMATYLINDHFSINGGWRYWSVVTIYGRGTCTSSGYKGCSENSLGGVTTAPGGPIKYRSHRSGLLIGLTGKF